MRKITIAFIAALIVSPLGWVQAQTTPSLTGTIVQVIEKASEPIFDEDTPPKEVARTDATVEIVVEIRRPNNTLVATVSHTWTRSAFNKLTDEDVDAMIGNLIDRFRMKKTKPSGPQGVKGRKHTR